MLPGVVGPPTSWGRTSPSGTSWDGSDLLAALLDGMDAALCAFDADGVVDALEPRGRADPRAGARPRPWGGSGLAGWAVRSADAEEVEGRLLSAMHAPGRQVHEFALLTKDGGRVLVRTQSAAVRGAGREARGGVLRVQRGARADRPGAVHRAERGAVRGRQLGCRRWWTSDLRPAVVNAHAARALGAGRTSVLGRPLGELLSQGVEELESALHACAGARVRRPRPPRCG